MKDEEIEQFANHILCLVAQQIKPSADSQLIKAGRKWSFSYVVHTTNGNTVGIYNPLPAVKSLLKEEFTILSNDSAETKRVKLESLIATVSRMLRHFPVMMRQALREHVVVSSAHPQYDLLESVRKRLRAAGENAPSQRFADFYAGLSALRDIEKQRRRRAGVKVGAPQKNKMPAKIKTRKSYSTPNQLSIANSFAETAGLPKQTEAEYQKSQFEWKLFKIMYDLEGVNPDYKQIQVACLMYPNAKTKDQWKVRLLNEEIRRSDLDYRMMKKTIRTLKVEENL